ncbi:fam-b protein [Plasmodium vinckei lentum]|uniref:Fam-b protein n=1 Tax=Plasmodium vinckei lentum TaxID=138297 RepID=A0A6V7S447_PLAVN|nr:fam-b protein [Plasmodium vinckei lentum]
MRFSILKYALFLIIIWSFLYAQNEICFMNKRTKYIERNIINFRNNRILADIDIKFDLNHIHELTLSVVNQLIEHNCNDGDIVVLPFIINIFVKNQGESDTLPDLNSFDIITKMLIHAHQKELEKLKKELDNLWDCELEIQLIHDKKMLKKDKNISVSKPEHFKQLKNKGISSKEEDNKIDPSSNTELDDKAKLKKLKNKAKTLGFIYSNILKRINER